jgi:hypothetical protein
MRVTRAAVMNSRHYGLSLLSLVGSVLRPFESSCRASHTLAARLFCADTLQRRLQ